jgi:hypothetical protein
VDPCSKKIRYSSEFSGPWEWMGGDEGGGVGGGEAVVAVRRQAQRTGAGLIQRQHAAQMVLVDPVAAAAAWGPG